METEKQERQGHCAECGHFGLIMDTWACMKYRKPVRDSDSCDDWMKRQVHPMTHELKLAVAYFGDVNKGIKTFELRKGDRDYQVGDKLLLKEFNPKTKEYTGREFLVRVTYILEGEFTIPGMCLMSIKFTKDEWFSEED